MDLHDRVVIITGASGGLGRVVARLFAELGVRLVLVGTNADKLEELAQELGLLEENRLIVATDLGVDTSARKLSDAAIEKFGRADILLHFVGGWIGGTPVAWVNPQDLSTMIQQHIWTTFYLAQALVPQMVSNGWGRIVVISSPSVVETPVNGLPYTIGKSGEEALIMTLAQELKGTGVTANVIRVRTIDVNHERDRDQAAKTASWTTPEEIASAILYLCFDDARMVNGARIPLYGNP